MFRKTTLRLTISALALMVCFGIPNQAHALTITPIRYEISGDPGQTLTEKMGLVNETKTTQTYYASFSNFEAQGDTGSPTFIDAKDGLGTWITTEQASITLAAGAQKEIEFKIAIPKDAEAGGYFAAIFWGTSPGGAPGQVSIGTKTGLLILLSVNGDVQEQAGLVDFSLHNNDHFYKTLPVGFQYRFSNQGGDRVKPEGDVVIRSILGWTAKKIDANPNNGNVLPGTTRKFLPEWSKRDSVDFRDQEVLRNESYSFKKALNDEWHNFAFGIFKAKTIVSYGSTDQVAKSKSVYFIVFPWELLLVIIIVGIPTFFILRFIVRKYNRSVIRKAQKRFENNKSI
ncbi:MAG: hypothetical protein KBC11_03255 [Candidatus Pacebacteria bacterium]|nr:hypothetical protein [Candidatus Paceibacterota bacterium]